MSISTMLRRIQEVENKRVGAGATVSEITGAEETLGVTFPDSYRSFLGQYGWARFASEELYGLGSDVPTHLNLVSNTLAERTIMTPRMPTWLVPVLNDGAGNHVCINTAECVGGECSVVFWDHECGPTQKPPRLTVSFDAWLEDLLLQSF